MIRTYFHSIFLGFILGLNTSCFGQNQSSSSSSLGGPCEGCEAIYEYKDKPLSHLDTLPGFMENEPKLMLFGTVFQKDGITPAQGVILYIYHTDRKGIYPTQGNESGWGKRHGFLRGWVLTDAKGQYTFYTIRPAAYPDRTEPEHIHLTIKEPEKKEYYADDFLFADDPGLTTDLKKKLLNRAGNGVILPQFTQGIFLAKRDLILGLNIPNYE